MKVRTKLALTVVATGVLTTLLVIGAVLYGYLRFEREISYRRGSEFLMRVVAIHDNLLDVNGREPAYVVALMKNLLLFEPAVEMYLLDAEGTVLAATIDKPLPPGYRVAIEPVRQAAAGVGVPYVMGDDPARGSSDAVIAAQPLRRATIRLGPDVAGYLYLVCPPSMLPAGRLAAARASFGLPALGLIVAVVALTTLLAAWGIATVTRPLRRLTDAVGSLSATSLDGPEGPALPAPLAPIGHAAAGPPRDEFGQLAGAFRLLIERLREQWAALRRLDRFRREAVSNLSHDLRSPLTATAACLETLDTRWAAAPERAADRELLAVARRNTHDAARLVQSLGDLAQLDEPAYALRPQRVDLRELLDGLQMRFAERSARAQVRLEVQAGADALAAEVDIELMERALANLLDNALKFARAGDRITLAARGLGPGDPVAPGGVELSVADTGPGIPAADLPHLFDRFYQSRHGTAPATGEGGKGLGLAIVKRIAELHGGTAAVASSVEEGTRVWLRFPAAVAGNPS
jgi:signal transduction histidine kinase